MSDASGPVVLVVEDDPSVAETYERRLADDYDVRIGVQRTAARSDIVGSVS